MFLEHFPEDNRKQGWIEIICGSMFSGKTEELNFKALCSIEEMTDNVRKL